MKTKTTKKAMKESYDKIISIGYCDAQFLLRHIEPFAYSTRAEGWACDYYEVDNVLISTGYDPLTARNTKSSYNIVKEYDNKAYEIACNYSLSYDEQKAQINTLLKQYIKEVAQ